MLLKILQFARRLRRPAPAPKRPYHDSIVKALSLKLLELEEIPSSQVDYLGRGNCLFSTLLLFMTIGMEEAWDLIRKYIVALRNRDLSSVEEVVDRLVRCMDESRRESKREKDFHWRRFLQLLRENDVEYKSLATAY